VTGQNPLLLIGVLLIAACVESGAAPAPEFQPLFPAVTGERVTNSSPALADLDRDGVPDIVFGSGVDRLRPQQGRYVFSAEPEVPGYVMAVSGATNAVLWEAEHPGEAFTTPRFLDVNRDDVTDVIMGGREGAFTAYSGVDGSVLWRVDPAGVATTPVPYNFFTPALIRDVNDDRVADLVVVYGGDDTRLPGDPRDAGYIAVVSGADGAVLSVHATPDGSESYASTVVYERPDGREWLLFGTGGETHGGSAYRVPVASLLDGSFATAAERLVQPGAKGVMAPPTLVELTGDAEPDIVISTFDGRLVVVNGASGAVLWETSNANEEAYHPATVVRIARDGRLGLLLSRGIGAFPRYVGTVHRLYDAAAGTLLYEYSNTYHPAGAPLGVDLSGDGIDELIFFSMSYPSGHGGQIHIYHAPSRDLTVHHLSTNNASTALIADPRGTGTLELIALSWSLRETMDAPDWRAMQWHLDRLDLSAETPAFLGWSGYMGTHHDARYRTSTGVVE
jgi:hypothetical protein